MKNIIVLGGSYGGARAARVLASGLQTDHRVILIDRNSHANHVYVLPRLGVLPGHEHKAFIPYTRFFTSLSAPLQDTPSIEPGPSSSQQTRHLFLHATAIKLSANSVTLDRSFPEHGLPSSEIPFEYLVYALGSHLPAPIDLWTSEYGSDTEVEAEDDDMPQPGHSASPRTTRSSQTTDVPSGRRKERFRYGGTKREGIAWLKRFQSRVARSQNVLVVGGGALGVQYATDIATVYPTKHVTLLHSRNRLLPRFDPALHTEVIKGLEDARIDVILGERLDLSSISSAKSSPDDNGKIVRTEKGRNISCNLLLLCTGQLPNTGLLRDLSPESVDTFTGLAHVLPTMQLGVLPPSIEGSECDDSEPSILFDRETASSSTTISSVAAVSKGPSEADSPTLSFRPLPGLPSEQDASTTTDALVHAVDEKLSMETPYDYETETEEDEDFEEDTEDIEPAQESTPFPRIFVIGDAADAFGAIKAGHTASLQAEVAATNILRLIDNSKEGSMEDVVGRKECALLQHYVPGAPQIKVSLGLSAKAVFEVNGVVGRKNVEEPEDLYAHMMWPFFGFKDVTPDEMHL